MAVTDNFYSISLHPGDGVYFESGITSGTIALEHPQVTS